MARVIDVGSDKVIVDGNRLTIDAARPMRDWSVREYCHHSIYFQGARYLLVGKHRAAKPYAMRYELETWPADLHESSHIDFIYDADFVAARDRGMRRDQTHTLIWYAMLPVYPLLGLFWSGIKERLLWPIGFVPTSITSASVMLVFLFTFCDGMFYGYLGGGVVCRIVGATGLGGWAMPADLALMGLLGLDCALRFSQLLRGDEPVPYGFLEWIFRRGR